MKNKKVWWVDFPTYQYVEDVKKIAKERGLKIIDSRFKGKSRQVANAPELTKKKD